MSNIDHTIQAAWEEQIRTALQDFFEARGFAYLPALNQFRRPSHTGFQCVIMALSHYEDLSLLEIHLGIRQDEVEDLAHPFTNGLPGFRPNAMTLVCSMAKLFGESRYRYRLTDATRVQEAIQEIEGQFRKYARPFLQRYSRLEEFDQLFNSHPGEDVQLLHNQVNRCIRGIAIAKLVHRSDFDQLAERYRQRLDELHATSVTREKFERLYQYLRAYSAN